MSRAVERRGLSSNELIDSIVYDMKALRRRERQSDRCARFCVMLETAIYSGTVDWLPGDWMEALAWALLDGEQGE